MQVQVQVRAQRESMAKTWELPSLERVRTGLLLVSRDAKTTFREIDSRGRPVLELLRLRLLCQDRAASFSSISCDDDDGVGFELQMPRCRDSIAKMDDCLVGMVSRAWAESMRPLTAFYGSCQPHFALTDMYALCTQSGKDS